LVRARQDGLDRPVAVKVLAADSPGLPRELEVTVRLGRAHPNIVTILDTPRTADGRPCVVMEFYELGSLYDQMLAHGRLPANAVVSAGTAVADALAYAHHQGVLHRDVKPQNILVLPTSYALADFGPASLERSRHASPQVLDGERPTVADDIYSLGSTLFVLLDGRAQTPELAAIIDRCLAGSRDGRFPDAASLRDALAAVVTEERAWAPRPVSAPVRPAAPAPAPPVPAPLPRPPVRGPEPEPAPVDHEDDEDDEERPARSGWSRVWLFTALALIVGTLLGFGVPWALATRAPRPAPPEPVPSFNGILPSATGTLPNNPGLTPQIIALDDRGSSVELRWTDPSNGGVLFVIVRVDGTQATPLLRVDAGTTRAVINALDPAADRYCFRVLAISPTATAISEVRCTPAR
jgi:eukaryotic-like serine/threonine-protein kinase